jgi:hypothetical protein
MQPSEGQQSAEELAAKKPDVSDQLAKLCSWAVISMLNFHPRKEAMPPVLVYKTEENSSYQVQADLGIHDTLDELLSAAGVELERVGAEETVCAYALLVDSVEDVEGLPALRSFDDAGNPYPPEMPTLFVYMGERETQGGVLVVQAFKARVIRGGATPVDAPLILSGPDSLLFGAQTP